MGKLFDEAFLYVVLCAAFCLIGMLIGAEAQSFKDMGGHVYHDVHIISTNGKTVIRVVESPYSGDDQCLETIVDGNLISRTKINPDIFNKVWNGLWDGIPIR